MTHRRRPILDLALACALLSGCGGPTSPLAGTRPNILFVLTDDLRWDGLGAYGNASVRTPNLDALAREGLRFDAFYVASPVCQDSRAAFLTGLYPHQAGIEQKQLRHRIADGVDTLATHLGRAGYVTGFVGKAHLASDPSRWGFAEVPLYLPGSGGPFAPEQRHRMFVKGREKRVEGHAPRRLVNAAIRFVERHRDERWFLWVAPTSPHFPYEAHPDFVYRPEDLDPPPGLPPGQFSGLGRWQGYYSLVSRLDHHLGRLFARLDELGLSENTLVLVTSDNGIMHGSHGTAGKGVWYDEATRVPALLRWPGRMAAGSTSASLVSSVDLLPTLLELAGLDVPADLEGRSFLPVLAGEATRSLAYSEFVTHTRGRQWAMVRDGRYKLVELPGGRGRLYDLERDPYELENRVEDPALAERALALFERLAEWDRATP